MYDIVRFWIYLGLAVPPKGSDSKSIIRAVTKAVRKQARKDMSKTLTDPFRKRYGATDWLERLVKD